MVVLSLQAENVKRLRAVRIEPNDPTVTVGGKNGQGKSSVLDCIQMALGGKDAVPDEPIRRGASSGKIVLETEEYIVKRTFSGRGGSALEVTTKAGVKVPSPQATLDALTSSIGFDPLAFSQLNAKDQASELRELVGIDTATIDRERKEAFEERTVVNRQLKSQKAIVDALPMTGPAMVDVSAVMQECEEIRERNRVREEAVRALNGKVSLVENAEASVESLTRQLDEARQKLTLRRREVDVAEAALKEMPEFTDVAPLLEKIRQAGETNKLAAKVQERKKEAGKLADLEKQSDDLTAKIDDLDSARSGMIANAKFPVSGLGFSEAGVTFNDIPFSQASRSEQIRVGMAIAIAKNPAFRVVLIRDGSLLDDDAMEVVHEMAAANGFQVWIEIVGTDRECTVLIEDGEAVEHAALTA